MNAIVRTRPPMRCGVAAAASLVYTAVIPLALLLASGIGLASDPAPTDQLAGGCLQGTGASRPNQVERHPGTTYSRVSDGLSVTRLDSLVTAGRRGVESERVTSTWLESSPHPYLNSVLRGARFITYLSGNPETPDWRSGDNAVFFRDRLYYLDNINQLLFAAGWSLDSSQMTEAAKVLVLLRLMRMTTVGHIGDTAADRIFRLNDEFYRPRQWADSEIIYVPPSMDAGAPAFPAVEFLSVVSGRLLFEGNLPKGWRLLGVLVRCTVDGFPRVFFVEFCIFGETYQPCDLIYRNDRPMIPGVSPEFRHEFFDWVRPPSTPGPDGRGSSRGQDDPEGSLKTGTLPIFFSRIVSMEFGKSGEISDGEISDVNLLSKSAE